jgi:hypothetical protein
MGKEPDFSYINKTGKLVSGVAAFVHHVYTEKGGVQNYNDAVGAAYITKFVKAHSDDINAELAVQARRGRLKKIS